jgi:hypothetical protein
MPFLYGNRNDSGANDSIQYHSLLADSLGSCDLADFLSRNISVCKRIRSLSFWDAMKPSKNIIFMQFHGNSFWPHDMNPRFSPWAIFNARNFFLPGVFDMM